MKYLYSATVCLIIFFAGFILGRTTMHEQLTTNEIISISLQRSLDGCEVVASQCLDDVNEAEYYFKICYEKLKQYTGE